jgi:hypothetical protein
MEANNPLIASGLARFEIPAGARALHALMMRTS